MVIPTLEGITSKNITTTRISTRVLFGGSEGGEPVLFLHGNWSCATWWEESLLRLPEGCFGIAPDLRGYGQADLKKKVNAENGAGDWVDDAVTLLDYLGYESAHIVGCSLGGYVVWKMMLNYPGRIRSVVLVNPGSPYGFSGTRDMEGTPCFNDFAGTGGGIRNQAMIQRVKEGDRDLSGEFSPRAGIRSLFIAPFVPEREEALLSSVLSTHLGEQDIPGDFVPSPNWPFVAPGNWGPHNAVSPKYADDIKGLYDGRISVPVLWLRGSHDQVVSDQSRSDIGCLGKQGFIPGWPGEEIYPPQPMLKQTRHVLGNYQKAGGSYREVIIEDTAHIPFIERPDEFSRYLAEFISDHID